MHVYVQRLYVNKSSNRTTVQCSCRTKRITVKTNFNDEVSYGYHPREGHLNAHVHSTTALVEQGADINLRSCQTKPSNKR